MKNSSQRTPTFHKLRGLPLERLPEWSPWPGRILGAEPWRVPVRSLGKIESEYNQDKYAHLLAYLEAHPRSGMQELRAQEIGIVQSAKTCISRHGKLHLTTIADARRRYSQLLLNTLTPWIKRSAVVLELGCGYGYNLWFLRRHFPEKQFIGGEFASNAIEIAARLFQRNQGVQVWPFNYYDVRYSIVERLEGRPFVLFTSHSIEQLPSAAHVVKMMAALENLVAAVHFEPITELNDGSLLGLLRRRYTEINDYNRDLLICLRQQSGIVVTQSRYDELGANPLNPTSIVSWRRKISPEVWKAKANGPLRNSLAGRR